MDVKKVGFNITSKINAPKMKNRAKDFAFTLTSKIEESKLKEKLTSLINEIDEQGKKISQRMDIKDLKKYKGLIGDFINETVTHSHKFSRENMLDRRGHHRVWANVKIINKNIDDIAKQLISEEKDNILILDKIDEIRGLLLDIMT